MKVFSAILALAFLTLISGGKLKEFSIPSFITNRVINGQNAIPGEAPYIVSLKRGIHDCGGSIIHPNWVLTAAHCIESVNFRVVAGLHRRSDETGTQIREVTNSNHVIRHEGYLGIVGPNDIGLIYIADAFDLNVSNNSGLAPVDKIALPSGNYSETGDGKLFGWGRDKSNSLPNVLQTLDSNIIGYKACKAKLPSDAPIAKTNICTYTPGKTDGACKADSGGPLTRQTDDGPELVGIVSWGSKFCGWKEYPSVYVRVSAFLEWILNHLASPPTL